MYSGTSPDDDNDVKKYLFFYYVNIFVYALKRVVRIVKYYAL